MKITPKLTKISLWMNAVLFILCLVFFTYAFIQKTQATQATEDALEQKMIAKQERIKADSAAVVAMRLSQLSRQQAALAQQAMVEAQRQMNKINSRND